MQIRLESLQKSYKTDSSHIKAVQNISLDIPSNAVFGIIGKSGAGKSTLVRLISLLEKPDSGSVYFGGERVDDLEGMALITKRRGIGMIFQNFNLFSSRTAAGNIAYPLEICGIQKSVINERVKELLALVGLSDRGNAPVSTLSGGQKQRVAIARALANNPGILFCDEATSALDPQTTRSILYLLREIQKKMNLTIVMITHQMEVVRDACDFVAVLDDGKVCEQGRVTDIFTHPQSPVTKDFLSHISLSVSEDAPCPDGIVRWSEDGGHYTLRFLGDKTGEPLLSRASRMCNVDFNIRAGGIQHLSDQDIGSLIVDIDGKKEEIQKALTFLKEEGVIVEDREGNIL
jgi:D-methionine transport system ATP-binding protein